MDSSWEKRKCLRSVGRSELIILAFQLLLGLMLLSSNVQTLELAECTMPLGMESGEIADTDITVSSSFDSQNVGGHIARIRKEEQGGAWCPKHAITSEAEEWIEIDLHTTRVITITETQGRFGNGQGQEFAEKYLISYWRPQLNKWVRYRDNKGNEILTGNINTYLAAKAELNPPIIASKVRIHPFSDHRRTVCMRVEIYGCLYKGGLLSYSTSQGSKMGENWELYDHTYDGYWKGDSLRDGLGQLTDGRSGPTNFKDDFYAPERGKGWMGWKNDSRNASDPLEIVFTFESVREFSSVHIYTSNQFTKDIQVFSEARVLFSVGGKLYPGDPIVYVPMEDCIFEDAKNVTIKLQQRIGKYVKIQLFWASKWILISEITFDSQIAMGNFTEEGNIITVNETKGVLNSPSDTSRVLMDNPIKVARESESSHSVSVADQQNPTLVEDFPPAPIVMTAIISSSIAVVLVLISIFAVFLMRNKLFMQEKMPPSSHPVSMHYGEVGFGENGMPDFGYASPAVVFLGDRNLKAKSPPTLASSLSRDYEPSKPLFSGFVGSTVSGTAKSNGGSSSGGKLTEYYSSAPVPNLNHYQNTDLTTNEYEYVSKETGFRGFGTERSKSPRRSAPASPLLNYRSHSRNIHLRLRELDLPEIPKHRLKVLRKLGDGVFGSMFIGEIQTDKGTAKHLVAVKRLLRNASDKDKLDFLEEVRILSTLNDVNVAQVLGLCTEEEPFWVALEFLDMGDLREFLRGNDTLHTTSSSKRKLSFGDLLHLGSQIASGMKYLEGKGIVHRDLATRNCVVSRSLTVKISHFATDTGLYSQDYYQIDGKMPLPIRWMAWESVFLGKYSTKSDVWSFGVTLHEILTFCRQSPYASLTDQEVIHNLRRLSLDEDSDPFQMLDHPYNTPRDIYELMCDTWRRNDVDRPSFWEIHCFLMRKNMNHNRTIPYSRTNNTVDHTAYYV